MPGGKNPNNDYTQHIDALIEELNKLQADRKTLELWQKDIEDKQLVLQKAQIELEEKQCEGYNDPFSTPEQKKRDKENTNVLKAFAKQYIDKNEFNNRTRETILRFCLGLIVGIAIFCAVLVVYFFAFSTNNSSGNLIALVTTIISFAGTIIGTLNIVTKHVFPQYEEKQITEIVKATQRHDRLSQQNAMSYTKGLNSDSEFENLPGHEIRNPSIYKDLPF